jgi:hypothetical protein
MFTMIGGDGQEYGPVSAEQLRAWILDHRANGRTLVRAEGETDWKPLFLRPEFADALAEAARRYSDAGAGSSSEAGPVTPATEVSTDGAAAARAGTPGRFAVLDCVSRGWGLLQRHMPLILWASFLVWLIPSALGFLGVLGALTGWLLAGPLYGGLCVLVLKLARGQPAGFREVWACFDARFVTCLLVWVFTGAVTELGLLFLLVPGIFFATVWAFSLPLAADRGLDFVAALRESWRVVTPRFFRVLGLLVLAFLPYLVFSGYCLVVTTGWVMEALGPGGIPTLGELLDKLPELARRGAVLAWQQQIVFALNLPFAWGVLMTAYEDLVTAGRT